MFGPGVRIAEANASGTDVGDLVHVDGRLEKVRSPAGGSGMLRL